MNDRNARGPDLDMLLGNANLTLTPGVPGAPAALSAEAAEALNRRRIDQAKKLLQANDFVVLRARSHRQAQERQRVAEARVKFEEMEAEHARQWALECLARERHLADRCTFLYGAARAHGATIEELGGSLHASCPHCGGLT